MNPVKATLEDYRRIKTRASWQIILEVGEYEFPQVMESLGNPVTGQSIWVALVRLDENAVANQQAAESKLEEV